MLMNDKLFCVDEKCNLAEKLISNWINFFQHQELEHKMLTIQQFKSYLIKKQSIDGPQFNEKKKNQYLSKAKDNLNFFFEQIESRIQQLVKKELQEIFDMCLNDLEIKIENCIINDVIHLDNFETYFQFEDYQSKCLNFYHNNLQNQIQDIINQFCTQRENQFENIFKSIIQAFSHQKYLLQQLEQSKNTPQIQQQTRNFQNNQNSFKEQQQVQKVQQDYFQYKQYTQESKPEPSVYLKVQYLNDKIQQDYLQQQEYTQEFNSELSHSTDGKNYIDQSQQNYFQYKDYKPETQQESLLPLKGYKSIEKMQQDYYQYKEQTQEPQQDSLHPLKGYKQVQILQWDQIKIDVPTTQTLIQSKKKKKLNSQPQQQFQVEQKQQQVQEIVQGVAKILPLFKQISGKVEHFSLQLMNGIVELLDNFKTAKSQCGFILFDGFLRKTTKIKLDLLIFETDKESEIEIGLIDWSTFKLPRETGKIQNGVCSINNKGSQFREGKQKNKEQIFKNQTKLNIIINKQITFVGEKSIGFSISSMKGDLSFFACLKNAQIQITS